MIKTNGLYYASDKALFDALNQQKMNKASLAELLLDRGIIVSSKTEKKEIAMLFSRMTHDYFDNRFITNQLSSGRRKEKSTTTRLSGTIEADLFEKVARQIEEEQTGLGAKVTLHPRKNGLDIEIKYKVVDYNKTELKQIEERSGTISLDLSPGGMNVRSPANDYIEGVKNSCLDKVFENFDDKHKPIIEKISLINYPSHLTRTAFFKEIIKSVGKYKLVDVTDVWVSHPKLSQDSKDDDDIGIHISSASLAGEGVTHSTQFKELTKAGFYISKIVWTAKTSQHDSSLYTFEALFLDPEICDSFAYQVKGINKYSETEKTTVKKRQLVTQTENDRLSRLIEESARKIHKRVISGELGGRKE